MDDLGDGGGGGGDMGNKLSYFVIPDRRSEV